MNTIDSEVEKILLDAYTDWWNDGQTSYEGGVAERTRVKTAITNLIAQETNKAQHLHRFDDKTYRCGYCGLSNKELHDNTSRLTSEKGKA